MPPKVVLDLLLKLTPMYVYVRKFVKQTFALKVSTKGGNVLTLKPPGMGLRLSQMRSCRPAKILSNLQGVCFKLA